MILKIKNISKHYIKDDKKLLVLDNINFDILNNEFLCIIGQSGCGKTTLLKIIIGLIKPSFGDIVYDKSKNFFALVFQEHNLLPWKNIFQNIAFPLELYIKDKKLINKIVDKLIKLIDLSKFKNYYPHQLSEGMKQKIGIARALAINPKILLMDEPFAQLDAITREYLQKKLMDIVYETKKSVIFVTHNIDEALFLADKIIVLGKKPTRIRSIIKIDIPKPRWNLDKKNSIKFFIYRNKIKNLIDNKNVKEN